VNELRVRTSRKDGQYYKSVDAYGNDSVARLETRIPHGVKPSKELPKEAIVAALKGQFGETWENFVWAKRKLVLADDVTPEKLVKIMAALKKHGLDYGTLVVEEVEYKPTDLLLEQETMDPKVAAKVGKLRAARIVKPTVLCLKQSTAVPDDE